LFLKELLKILTNREAIGNAITQVWLLFFAFMAWLCFGLIAFGLLFQWIIFLLLPTQYDQTLSVFLIVWSLFGLGCLWYFNKKPSH
jgi:uncharacterized protein with PQ loop repeat